MTWILPFVLLYKRGCYELYEIDVCKGMEIPFNSVIEPCIADMLREWICDKHYMNVKLVKSFLMSLLAICIVCIHIVVCYFHNDEEKENV